MSTLAHVVGVLSALLLSFILFGMAAEVEKLRYARYLGWAFVVVALMLLAGMFIAMRYDYVRPVGEDS